MANGETTSYKGMIFFFTYTLGKHTVTAGMVLRLL